MLTTGPRVQEAPARSRGGRHRRTPDGRVAHPRPAAGRARPSAWPYGPGVVPSVSVVIPCRHNERTIRPVVEALLGQSYPGLAEVILVGSTGDRTWQALADITDRRLVLLEQEPTPGLRDPNIKRDKGIRRASGDVLALVDSDIVMGRDWLATGMGLLASSGSHCIAGGMESIHDSFWGRFVDTTRMGAKTPRVGSSYVVTAENFGRGHAKPPVTANVIFTRRLYADAPLDVHWSYGYEDYEWFWRVTAAGYPIWFSHELAGRHHHRRGLRPLCTEYLRSSDGCAKFVRAHPDCPLARKRLQQMITLPLAALGLVALPAVAAAAFHRVTGVLEVTGAVAAIGALAAAVWEYAHQRLVDSLVYPALNAIFGSLFVVGMIKGMVRGTPRMAVAPAPVAAEVTRLWLEARSGSCLSVLPTRVLGAARRVSDLVDCKELVIA
jgi:hypothetical protein